MSGRRRAGVGVLVVAALMASLLASLVVAQPAGASTPRMFNILVMGDSYSAGNGAGTDTYYGPKRCYRSSNNYGSQFARWMERSHPELMVNYWNTACSGATSAALTDWYTPDGGSPQPPQIQQVNASTDLILMTAGGNDLFFADIAAQCLVPVTRKASNCKLDLETGFNLLRTPTGNQADSVLGKLLYKRLKAVRQAASPQTQIVLLGYPYLEKNPGYVVSSYPAGAVLGRLQEVGDQTQSAVIDRLNANLGGGFLFENTKSLFAGHEPDSPWYTNWDRWINAPLDTPLLDCVVDCTYHPNHIGHNREALMLAGDNRVVKYDVQSAKLPSSKAIDVVFAVDTTGSMGGEISSVQDNASRLVDRMASTGGAFRFGLVNYRDHPVSPYGDGGDWPGRVDLDFTTDTTQIHTAINNLAAGGGNDTPEAVYSGVHTADAMSWRPGAKRIVILLGDAPPHDPEPFTGYTLESTVADALFNNVQIFSVSLGYSMSEFTALAERTGGVAFTSYGGDLVDQLLQAIVSAAASPSALLDAGAAAGVGVPVSLSAAGSSDPAGSALRYDWDFDSNGTVDQQTASPETTHAFTTAGPHLVTVKVTDAQGLPDVAWAVVYVPAPGEDPTACAAGTSCAGPMPQPVVSGVVPTPDSGRGNAIAAPAAPPPAVTPLAASAVPGPAADVAAVPAAAPAAMPVTRALPATAVPAVPAFAG